MNRFSLHGLTPNLMVYNVQETISFYKDILGFSVVMTVPEEKTQILEWAMLTKDAVTIMFQKQDSLIQEYPEVASNLIGKGLTLFIQINEIEDLYVLLQGKVTMIKELTTTFYGMKEFAITDCNGYVLTFAQQ